MASFTRETFTEVLMRGLQHAVRKILEEEAEKASKEVERRVKAEADLIALNVLSHYDVTQLQDRLVITVKKE